MRYNSTWQKASCQLLCLQLEDWLEMTEPVNVPGTSDEYPNWRRKLTHTLEQLEQQKHIEEHLQQFDTQPPFWLIFIRQRDHTSSKAHAD
ncbi:MAG: 4-alpha-glucanotransferase [Rheinheimera sp.]|nr:4-alpha-glucanotransferase [Rheinheimera sp.]